MRSKIAYLSVHLNYGGAEVGLLTTLRNIDRERFDCRVISIEKKGPIGDEIEKLGFGVTYLNENARLFNLGLLAKIVREFKKDKPDILHTSLFYANFFGRVAAIFSRPSAIVTEERSMYTEKRFYHILIDRLLSLYTDKIIVCSDSVRDFTIKQEGINPEKFYRIYNAVDAERFTVARSKEDIRDELGFVKEEFLIGSVGSVIPKKGHIDLIKALAEVIKAKVPAKLLIAGEGESKNSLERFCAEMGLSDKVKFLGARKDVPEIMKALDVFVLPSYQEGFPRTLIEAMYMGIPVIVSNISGIPEVVIDGENGFLVEPGDAEAIKDRVVKLFKDNTLRLKIAQSAKLKIGSGYLPGHYIKSLESLYEALLQKRATS